MASIPDFKYTSMWSRMLAWLVFMPPFNWIGNMQTLSSAATCVLEIGPQRVLGKFFGAIGKDVQTISDLKSLEKFLRHQRGPNA